MTEKITFLDDMMPKHYFLVDDLVSRELTILRLRTGFP